MIRWRARVAAPGRRSLWLALLFGLPGLAAIVAGLVSIAGTTAFALRAESAEARVVRVMAVASGRRGVSHHPVVAFRTRAGAEVEARVASGNGWIRAWQGETLPVRYDPAQPGHVEMDGTLFLSFGPLLAIAFGAVFLGAGWTALRGGGQGPARLVGTAIAALLLLASLFLAVQEAAQTLARLRATERVEARIVESRLVAIAPGSGPGAHAHAPVAAFAARDGRVVRVTLAPQAAEPVRGTAVTLRVLPARPEAAAVESWTALWLRPALAAGAFAALAAGLALLVRRRGRIQQIA